MKLGLVLLVLAGTPALGDACHDLWFTRNLIMDRAGHCFSSTLGRALFDNSGCIGTGVALDGATARAVADIRAREREYGCRVNTAQPVLNLPDRDLRLRLHALPIADNLESACLNYLGPPIALYAAPDANAPIIGQINTGDNVGYGHLPHNGWGYVTTHGNNRALQSGGWLGTHLSETSCAQWAG